MESPDYFLSGTSTSEEDSYTNPPELVDGFRQSKDGDSTISKMRHEYYKRLQRLGCGEIKPRRTICKLGIECVHDIQSNPPKDSCTEQNPSNENLVEDFDDSSFKEIYDAYKETDLELLKKKCDKLMSFDIDKAEEFSLSQASLLYLISKLGVEVHEDTELKLGYLEKAVLNLAKTRSSMMKCTPLVLQKLVEELNDFQKLHASSEYLIRVNILELAIMSLL